MESCGGADGPVTAGWGGPAQGSPSPCMWNGRHACAGAAYYCTNPFPVCRAGSKVELPLPVVA